MLLMCWMVLRADDVQWIDPTRMHMSGTCVRMILRRTKTTGPGRRAVEVPAYVARDASLSGKIGLDEDGSSTTPMSSGMTGTTSCRVLTKTGLEVPENFSVFRT